MYIVYNNKNLHVGMLRNHLVHTGVLRKPEVQREIPLQNTWSEEGN